MTCLRVYSHYKDNKAMLGVYTGVHTGVHTCNLDTQAEAGG